MHDNFRTYAAIVGGCAVVALGALSVGVVEGQSAPASAAGAPQMQLGATSTETTPPAAPAVAEAIPAIKGPAKFAAK